ncbi:von Willebrand factor D and EGF domain-containing protein-like [Ptychodera flava]|uniref:von Willebrand factor D and EGF domain-containing protein-like n=1 Tax=Ptychodera flava TaxID=63121 RepID=UPI00396A8858
MINDKYVYRQGVESAICYSEGDPHFKTFDGGYRKYDWYGTGDYVMVKEKVEKMEVNLPILRFTFASRRAQIILGDPSCNCAVAVREGNDVAIVDGCGLDHGYIDARITNPDDCDPGFVVSISPDGFEFQKKMVPKLHIEVNGLMKGRVEGLCGSFNGNEDDDFDYFDTESNTYVTDKCEPLPPGFCCSCIPEKFSRSFKLPKGTSLFYTDKFEPKNFAIKNFYPMCQCLPEDTNKPAAGSTIYCQTSFAKPMLKFLGDNGVIKYKTKCNDVRKRRSGQDVLYSDEDEYDPYAYEIPDNDFVFNPDNFKWPTASGVTEDDARLKCTEAIFQSNIAERCQEIDEARKVTVTAIEDCVFDILVMDDLRVVNTARSTMESVCLSTFAKNTSLWEIDENGELAPPASVVKAVCLKNCNGNGNCTMDGTCVCKEGYTAVDCGIEIVRLDTESWVETGTTMKTAAGFASAYSAHCFLPLTRVRRQIRSLDEVGQSMQAQRISLSNDGVIESNSLFVMTYDSLCLNCSDSGTCILKDDACLINGKCYAPDETSPFDRCLQCQLDVANDEWTVITEGDCGESTTESSVMQSLVYSNDWLIPTVVTVPIGAIILAAVVITVAICRYKKKGHLNNKTDALPLKQSEQRPSSRQSVTAWAEPK